jgi:hypothetical protein
VWAVGDLGRLESALSKGLGAAPPVLLGVTSSQDSYADAIESASCLPNVAGVLLDQLVDGAAATPVRQAIRNVARGAAVCPGVAVRVTPTALTLPDQLASSTPVSVALGCNRDCLYLVTLDRASGQPVVALRGSLAGGAPAQTITLPGAKLRAGSYRVDVRLVSRVGPGAVTRERSPVLNVR